MGEDPIQIDSRLARLEEGQAFGERRAEVLHEEVAALGRRVHELTRRLEAIERRLESVDTKVGELSDRGVEAPPHAAGPDVPREPL